MFLFTVSKFISMCRKVIDDLRTGQYLHLRSKQEYFNGDEETKEQKQENKTDPKTKDQKKKSKKHQHFFRRKDLLSKLVFDESPREIWVQDFGSKIWATFDNLKRILGHFDYSFGT